MLLKEVLIEFEQTKRAEGLESWFRIGNITWGLADRIGLIFREKTMVHLSESSLAHSIDGRLALPSPLFLSS